MFRVPNCRLDRSFGKYPQSLGNTSPCEVMFAFNILDYARN